MKYQEKLIEEKKKIEELLANFAKEENPNVDNWSAKFPQYNDTDMESEADEVEEYTTSLSIEQALEKKLNKINEALKKIDDGQYGICEKCGQKIDEKRLDLVPEAKTCQKC